MRPMVHYDAQSAGDFASLTVMGFSLGLLLVSYANKNN